jgi:hypothetical protein
MVLVVGIVALIGSCAKKDDDTAATATPFTSTTTAAGSITVGSVAMSGTYAGDCTTLSAAVVSGGYFPSDVKAARDVLVVTGSDNISEEFHGYTDTSCSSLSFYLKDGNDNFTVGVASNGADGEIYHKVTYKETGFKAKAGTTVAEAFYENYFSTNSITKQGTAIDLVVDTEYDVGGSGKNLLNLYSVTSTTVQTGEDDDLTTPTEMDSWVMTKQ